MMTTRHFTVAERDALLRKLRAAGRGHIAESIEAGTPFISDGVRYLPPVGAIMKSAPLVYTRPCDAIPSSAVNVNKESSAPSRGDAARELAALAMRGNEGEQ